jgi:hypothetical protein
MVRLYLCWSLGIRRSEKSPSLHSTKHRRTGPWTIESKYGANHTVTFFFITTIVQERSLVKKERYQQLK